MRAAVIRRSGAAPALDQFADPQPGQGLSVGTYTAGLAAEWPVVSHPYFVGPLVRTLGGADISWLAGWFAAAVAYLLLTAVTLGTARHDRQIATTRPMARRLRQDHGVAARSAASSMTGLSGAGAPRPGFSGTRTSQRRRRISHMRVDLVRYEHTDRDGVTAGRPTAGRRASRPR
jgi:hypothetical protein